MPVSCSAVGCWGAWALPRTANIQPCSRITFRANALPPPSLPGSAASNPRSLFNPLVLAYLGDAVWEAHIRRIETYIESWISQQQQSRTYVKSAVNEREQGGVNDGAWQAAVKRRQLQHGNTTPFVRAQPGRVNDGARGGKHDRERGRGGADAVSGFCSEDLRVVDGDGWDLGLFSRSCRKQWSTAVFQALVFDALMAGRLPLPCPGTFPRGLLHYILVMELQTPHRHPTLPPLASTPGYPLSPTVPSTQLSASRAPSAPSVHAAAAAAHVPDPDAIGAAAENSAPVSEGNQRNGGGVLPSGALVLTSAELEVLRWGRNAAVNSGSRDMSAREYKKATAVEVLVAHMYLTDPARCAALVAAVVAAPLARTQEPLQPTPSSSSRAAGEATFGQAASRG